MHVNKWTSSPESVLSYLQASMNSIVADRGFPWAMAADLLQLLLLHICRSLSTPWFKVDGSPPRDRPFLRFLYIINRRKIFVVWYLIKYFMAIMFLLEQTGTRGTNTDRDCPLVVDATIFSDGN